ncbi:hypothetical protein [Neisseria sp. Ec49-e6-T10]|uniref:hypothetical protein n=1 Tax=Neisseria sp. Ec49-e6-T10 TaxID=3140744 RepID=UPI003EB9DD13
MFSFNPLKIETCPYYSDDKSFMTHFNVCSDWLLLSEIEQILKEIPNVKNVQRSRFFSKDVPIKFDYLDKHFIVCEGIGYEYWIGPDWEVYDHQLEPFNVEVIEKYFREYNNPFQILLYRLFFLSILVAFLFQTYFWLSS